MKNSTDLSERALMLVAALAFFSTVATAASVGASGAPGQAPAADGHSLEVAAAAELGAACANRYGSRSAGWYVG
ncbi:MAG TPA: hypothetical protein PL143_05590 [Rhodocyclaceae bacterium]|nr:hypothetical protein [Rhodocyclaceae bacterium]